ncbi:hypothetical protein GP486_006883 [Trichoglossum hirsutum]|uniref:Peptidase S8/S53 domain-containing protein n=1 Tax=Trichoglossum hirsutum TaxID=265104 RepID=A0A9P8IGN3_9PEZI|nr:hypothetical protein GP486_006883 [Trichoglossum hirsutum]
MAVTVPHFLQRMQQELVSGGYNDYEPEFKAEFKNWILRAQQKGQRIDIALVELVRRELVHGEGHLAHPSSQAGSVPSDSVMCRFYKSLCAAIFSAIEMRSVLNRCFQRFLFEKMNAQEKGEGDLRQKWEKIATSMYEESRNFSHKLTPIIESTGDDVASHQSPSTGMNNLHAAVLYGCTGIVQMIIQDIKDCHRNQPELSRRVILAENSTDVNALAIAIGNNQVQIAKLLLGAEPGLATTPDFGSKLEHYPLHYLIDHILRPVDVDEPTPPVETWCELIQDIVKIDPVRNLTARCNLSKRSRDGDTPLGPDMTPYQMATRASKGREEEDLPLMSMLRAVEEQLEELIWRYLEGTSIQKAGLDNMTDLNLSDFDAVESGQQINNFASFVEKFKSSQEFNPFSPRLTRLNLPDISTANSPEASEAVVKLLNRLKDDFKIDRIIRLSAKNSHSSRISDDLIASWVGIFGVEELSWEKYDFDISSLVSLADKKKLRLRHLSLYTTGHKGVLSHWTSPSGILAMPEVNDSLFLKLGTLQTANLEQLEVVSIYLVEAFKDNLVAGLPSQSKDYVKLKDWIEEEYKTSTKKAGMEKSPALRVVLTAAHPAKRYHKFREPSVNQKFDRSIQTAQALLESEPREEAIKIAIIDNGVSCGLQDISGNIKGGDSFVYDAGHCKTPWFTPVDPHGTHMASLIVRANPYCDLYVYRVCSEQRDLKDEHVAQAIEMALKAKVDIINFSWSFDAKTPKTEKALLLAKSTLVFCAKPDALKVYPADYRSTISVTQATNQPLTLEVDGSPDLVLPGENVAVRSPPYAVRQDTQASGSSVSTALAAGVASLVLMLSREWKVENWDMLKQKDVMIGVFKRFMGSNSSIPYVNPQVLFGDTAALEYAMKDNIKRHGREL